MSLSVTKEQQMCY